MPSKSRHSGHSSGRTSSRHFPRTARINEVLREVIAEELEQIGDDGLDLVTVTGVNVDPDLRHATVWFSALTGASGIAGATKALAEHRVELQAAVARQVRMKWTPLLQFKPDPAITEGMRIEDVIRTMPRSPEGIHDEWEAALAAADADALERDPLAES